MEKAIINEELIDRITHLASIREKAFFTLMRQSGLKAKTIARLKVKNLEKSERIPRKIDVSHELNQSKTKKLPHFIGKEANRYLKQYLTTRNNLTQDSLLFTNRSNENNEISTKSVSGIFNKILKKIDEKNNNQTINKMESTNQNFSLKSLTTFYISKTKNYRKEIVNNPNENDEYYRKLYSEKAMPFLEPDAEISYKIIANRREFKSSVKYFDILDTENREMTIRIARNTEFISSILTLLYDNNGDLETGENEEIGDKFIELWKEVSRIQFKNIKDFMKTKGKIELIPCVDIVEELTKTLKRIKRPYDELERKAV